MAFTNGFTMSHSLHWLLAVATTLGTAAAQALPLAPLKSPGPSSPPSVSSEQGCQQTRGGWSCASSAAPDCLFAETKGGLSCLPREKLLAEKGQI
ncbi:MAG: hypothetical protein VKM17_11795 [Cyanobacteriota bacterium]|nr:hypothetical protein [Cyanobacteriota bacterium]